VGFVMLYDPTLPGAKPHPDFSAEEVTLWRFLIDGRHQGLGFGARALDLVIRHARTRPGMRRLSASYAPIPAGPEGFYLRRGFKKTGRLLDDGTEVEIALDL
jgi:diamine N-acetyltransferase